MYSTNKSFYIIFILQFIKNDLIANQYMILSSLMWQVSMKDSVYIETCLACLIFVFKKIWYYSFLYGALTENN